VLQDQIQGLSLSQLEALAEALLDFTQASDLAACLEQQQQVEEE
jgi:hypothetical protein